MPTIDIDNAIDIFYGKKGPTLKQVIFRDAPHKYKLFGGGVGGGKTVALCAEALRLSMMYPGNRGFLGRHEGEALRRTTLVTMFSLLGEIEDVIHEKIVRAHNQTKKEIVLVNGSLIMYGGLGGREDQDRIKSLEIGHYEIDEASETNYEVNKMLKARLRWQLPDGTYPRFFGLYASNPEPGWVKDTFVTPHSIGSPLDEHIFVQALVKDNPYLPPGYLEDLRRDNPADWVERYVEGSWEAMEGQIWKEFDYSTHVFPNSKYPDIHIPHINDVNDVYKWAALDHGQANPTCLLSMYVDGDDNIFVTDEYYSKGIVSAHCSAIKAMYHVEEFEDIVADPTMWAKNREKDGDLWSVADEYGERDIFLSRANNDVAAGLNRVSEYFLTSPKHPHPLITDKVGSPRLFISARCPNLIKEVCDYIWSRKSSEQINAKEEPRKYKDHACDALRYGVITRPSPFEKGEKGIQEGTFDWYMNEAKRNRGHSEEKEGYIINA